MTCDSFLQELTTLITESWENDRLEPSESMKAHARDCRRCATRLAAASALKGPDPGTLVPSPDLEARILEGVHSQDAPRRTRRTRWVALAAAAAILVVVTAAVTTGVVRSRDAGEVEVHLVLSAPGATSVAVVGDWNAWDLASQSLQDANGDGVWELRFRVMPGQEYEYQFVVDGTSWISDPEALLQVDDGFGGTNSVLDI